MATKRKVTRSKKPAPVAPERSRQATRIHCVEAAANNLLSAAEWIRMIEPEAVPLCRAVEAVDTLLNALKRSQARARLQLVQGGAS